MIHFIFSSTIQPYPLLNISFAEMCWIINPTISYCIIASSQNYYKYFQKVIIFHTLTNEVLCTNIICGNIKTDLKTCPTIRMFCLSVLWNCQLVYNPKIKYKPFPIWKIYSSNVHKIPIVMNVFAILSLFILGPIGKL